MLRPFSANMLDRGGDNTRLIWACQGENKRRHSIAPIVKTGVNFIEQMLERAQRRGPRLPRNWAKALNRHRDQGRRNKP